MVNRLVATECGHANGGGDCSSMQLRNFILAQENRRPLFCPSSCRKHTAPYNQMLADLSNRQPERAVYALGALPKHYATARLQAEKENLLFVSPVKSADDVTGHTGVVARPRSLLDDEIKGEWMRELNSSVCSSFIPC